MSGTCDACNACGECDECAVRDVCKACDVVRDTGTFMRSTSNESSCGYGRYARADLRDVKLILLAVVYVTLELTPPHEQHE